MAINEQPIEFEYIADGKTTIFPFLCRVIYESDLKVYLNGNQVFNYQITGVNNQSGGNVVFSSPPEQGSTVLLSREIKLVRDTEYQQNGDFLATTVNKDFDRIWMALQGTAGWFNRSLKYPIGGQHYDAENRRIENLDNPSDDEDAVTKQYTDINDAKLYEAINKLAENIIQGWIIVKSFQHGATLTLKNQILLNENDGRYYRWLGVFPKIVPANSTPDSAGGFGENAWVLVTIDNTQFLPLTGGDLEGPLTINRNPLTLVGELPTVGFRYKKEETVSKTGYYFVQDGEDFVLKKFYE